MNWFLYDKDLRYESVNKTFDRIYYDLLIAKVHW